MRNGEDMVNVTPFLPAPASQTQRMRPTVGAVTFPDPKKKGNTPGLGIGTIISSARAGKSAVRDQENLCEVETSNEPFFSRPVDTQGINLLVHLRRVHQNYHPVIQHLPAVQGDSDGARWWHSVSAVSR